MSETIEAAAPEAGTADEDLREVAATLPSDTPDDGDEAAEAAAEPEETEEVELSFGARKMAVPKGAIPDDVLTMLRETSDGMQKDYTEKTQGIAEQREQLKGERELVQKLATLKGEALQAYATGQALASEIQQLEAIDLRALRQSNPDQARWISDEIAMKRGEFNRQVNAVAQHETAMAQHEQQAIAKLVDAGRAEVQKAIKGFDDKAEAELVDHAIKSGVPADQARLWALNPKVAVMAWESMQYRKLQAGTKAATAAKPPSAPSAPVKAVSGRSSAPAAKSPENMSMEEFVRMRNAQQAKRDRG
jgi:hypothetical protein